jgi:type I restriction enzyme, S subunit
MRTAFREFLTTREDRFKPKDKSILSLQRINKIDFSGRIYLSDKSSNTDMILIKKGDLVISGINVEKGALSVYEGNDDITATIHYSSYSFDSKKIEIDYLKWFLKSQVFTRLVKEQVPGGIKTEIKPKHLLPLEIDLPDLEEQRDIVKRFLNTEKEYSELSHELSHQQSLLKKLRQAILQEAVQGKLVPQDPNDEPASELLKRIKVEKEKLIAEGDIRKEKLLPPIKDEEIPFELPKSWVWCRLGEIVSILGDGLHGTPQYSKDGEYYFINGNNLINGTIELKDNTKRVSVIEYEKYKKEMSTNTVLVSINGTLGNLAYFQNEKIILGKSACYFNLLEGVDKYYLGYLIKSNYFSKYAIEEASETTIKNVSLGSMRRLPIPLPPFSEQHHIVEKINSLISNSDQLEKQIDENAKHSELLLQAVLKEAFEPKTVYKTPEPAYRMVAEKK